MKENQIKKAFDNIEPEVGAHDRVYANILKNAAAKKENKNNWQRWGSLAACFAVIIAAGITLPRFFDHSESEEPPVFVGSPFEDVQGAADFEKLGFTIDVPENMENVTYCIFDGAVARIDFTLNGHEYTYEAAELDENFSRADGDPIENVTLNTEYDAVLDRLSPDTWRAHWKRDGINYYLTHFDGAEETAMTELVNTLIAQ